MSPAEQMAAALVHLTGGQRAWLSRQVKKRLESTRAGRAKQEARYGPDFEPREWDERIEFLERMLEAIYTATVGLG